MCRGGGGEAQRGRSEAAERKWMRSRGAGDGGRSRSTFSASCSRTTARRIGLLHVTKEAMEKRCPEKFCICEEKRLFSDKLRRRCCHTGPTIKHIAPNMVVTEKACALTKI
jgi:hypothetical protein